MFFTGQYQTQFGFARALRIAFQSCVPQFRYDPDPKLSKLNIYTAFPADGLRYPCIIISVAGGPALLRGIGGEIEGITVQEITTDGGSYNQYTSTKFSGQLRPTVTLDIRARDEIQTAQIVDWAMFFIRHFATDKFTREGLNVEEMELGPQTQQFDQSIQPVFGTTLSIRCLTSWEREIPISVTQTIDALCLTGIFTVLPDGVSL